MTTPNLDRLLALAADKGGTSYGKTAENAELTDDDMDTAHQMLRKQCPWYEKASAGAPVGDFAQHCQAAHGQQPPRLVVKLTDGSPDWVTLTPHTAEASTVDKPTVPPGGPGLFHVKGLHLPPYIQHLWYHLKDEYGAKKAYGIAVGVVKKWASGVNPGGWATKSGKGKKTHPDVQAAAQRNVAQWEEDRAKAHEQSSKTRDREQRHTADEGGLEVWLAATESKAEAKYSDSGGKPGHRCGDCTMFRAGHCTLVTGVISAGGICKEFEAKKDVKLAGTEADGEDPVASGKWPGQKQLPLPPVPSGTVAKSMYIAHRVDGTLYHLAHAAQRLMRARENRGLRGYHMIHVNNHLNFALGSGHELVSDLKKNFPAERKEWDAMAQTMGLTKALSPDTKAATFVHLLQTILYDETHAKRHALCMLDPSKTSDAEWLFNFDHAKKHMQGAMDHCFKLADHIRDNYPDIARWFSDLAKAEDPDDPYTGLTVELRLDGSGGSGLGGGAVVTAPGASKDFIPPPPGGKYSTYGLHQKPSQTVSPSPPLPPKVKEPTPQEVRALIPGVPESADVALSRSVRDFLESAAVKLEKDDELAALAMLRSASTAVFSANKADIGQVMPAFYTAGVFSKIPPAAQSSAGQAILQAQKQREKWRELAFAVQGLADRIRKRYFHGQYNGPVQQQRLADDQHMSELDKVLALAQPVTTGKDVSFPTTSDTSQEAKHLQPAEVGPLRPTGKAAEQLADLPPLSKVRVNAYLAAARECAQSNPYCASGMLLRAKAVCAETDAYHLSCWLHEMCHALGGTENATWPEATAAGQPGHGGWESKSAASGQTTRLSVELASAGSSAGKSAGSATPHQAAPKGYRYSAVEKRNISDSEWHSLHKEHLAHLAHLHALHLQHLAHMRNGG